MTHRAFPNWTSISPSNSNPLYTVLFSSEPYWLHNVAFLSPARLALKHVGDAHDIRLAAV